MKFKVEKKKDMLIVRNIRVEDVYESIVNMENVLNEILNRLENIEKKLNIK